MRQITKAILIVCVMSSCGSTMKVSTETLPVLQLAPVTTEPVILNAHEALQEDLATTTTTTTTTTEAPLVSDPLDYIDESRAMYGKCGEWYETAISVGWPNDPDVLQTLGQIMWRESRCQPDACSKSDSGRQCRDYGLIQGNWYAHHEWWTELGIEPQDMFDPATNLRWAYLLYSGREAQGKCGWQPWSLSC